MLGTAENWSGISDGDSEFYHEDSIADPNFIPSDYIHDNDDNDIENNGENQVNDEEEL